MILRKTNPSVRGGFTLMEMLVVVAILVILAGVGGYYYMGSLENAKLDTARLQIKVLDDACQAYTIYNDGNPPPNLQAILQPVNGKAPPITDPSKLNDPWGKPYSFNAAGSRNGGSKPDIWTISPNGVEIGNWPK